MASGGEGGIPGCFRKSFRFLFIHIKAADLRHVVLRGVEIWWMGNGRKSGTSVFAEEVIKKMAHGEHLSGLQTGNKRDAFVRRRTKKQEIDCTQSVLPRKMLCTTTSSK